MGHYLTYLVEGFAELPKDLRYQANFLRGNDQDHANPQVEGAAVILNWNIP